MVKIIDYKIHQREDGHEFFALVVQGGLEAVKSIETGRTYLTVKTARVFCTFDEATCKSLVGDQISGAIKKVEVEPYEYTNPETGETIERNHRYEFISEEDAILENNLLEEKAM